MTTVASIAKTAFDAVSIGISDAILDATLNDGASDYSGRVVFGGATAPKGFPMARASEKTRPAYLEGFSEVAVPGWTITAGGTSYYVLGVRDVLDAGGFQVVNVIRGDDMLWKSAQFQRRQKISDGAGGQTESWTDLGSALDIGIVAISGSDVWSGARLEQQAKYRAVTAPVDGLKTADRVMIGSTAYAITFVNDVELRGLWQVVDLAEGVAV